MAYRDLATGSGDGATALLERWASIGRAKRAAHGDGVLARIATGDELDPMESGMSKPEAFVGGLWVTSIVVLLGGFRLLGTGRGEARFAFTLAVPLWLLSVAFSIPVFGGLAVFRSAERAYIASLPLVIEGYLDALERARLVRAVRLRLTFAPGTAVDLDSLRDIFLGANVTSDLRPDTASSAFVYCRVPRSRALAIRQWFRKTLTDTLLPLHHAQGLRRVDVEEV